MNLVAMPRLSIARPGLVVLAGMGGSAAGGSGIDPWPVERLDELKRRLRTA